MCAAHGGQSSDNFRGCPPSLSAGIWTRTKPSPRGKGAISAEWIFTNISSCSRSLAGARHSAVGTATRYGFDGQGSNPVGGARFFAPVQTGPGAHPASYTMGKAAGAWRWPPIPYRAEVKERVELYLYSLSGPSWPVLRWPLHLVVCRPLHGLLDSPAGDTISQPVTSRVLSRTLIVFTRAVRPIKFGFCSFTKITDCTNCMLSRDTYRPLDS